MGICASKKQERVNKNKYIIPTQQNKKEEFQQSQSPEQQQQQQKQGQQLNSQENNEGSNKYPHFCSDFNSKMNNIQEAKDMRNDEQLQEEYHRQNYPNFSEKLNSNIQQQNPLNRCKIQCPVHQEMNIQLVNIGTSVNQRLMCYQCAYEKREEQIKTISIDEILKMSDNHYLDTFLVLEEPLLKTTYQQSLNNAKEIESSKYNIKLLEDFKVKVDQYIDQQIKLISESMDRLLKKHDHLNQSIQNCNHLSILQKYFSENDLDLDKLQQNISELLNQQQKQNKLFEQNLQEYFQIIQKETTGQQNIIDNVISQLNSICNNNKIFSKDIPNQSVSFQNTQMDEHNLLKEVTQIQTQQHYTKYPMNISFNDQRFISLKTSNNSNSQVSYINVKIDQNKKYEMQLDFKSKDFNQGCIFYQLSSQNTFQTQSFSENIFIPLLSQFNYTSFKIDKGISICKKKQDVPNLTIQISLKNKIFRWKFENNINSQQDWINLKEHQPYYILFHSYQNSNSEIIIKYLKEVSEFESW